MEMVRDGYSLPLLYKPNPYVSSNHSSALCNEGFVSIALSELLHNGCVMQVVGNPHICSPLLVVENSGDKKRLVVNLKYLYLHMWKDRSKYEDIRTALWCMHSTFQLLQY